MPNSLFNLTLRRVDRQTELTQLASATPERKASNLAALRFTYGWGDKQDAYVLAEVSNAKSTSATLANSAYKQSLGVDYKVGEGMARRFGACARPPQRPAFPRPACDATSSCSACSRIAARASSCSMTRSSSRNRATLWATWQDFVYVDVFARRIVV